VPDLRGMGALVISNVGYDKRRKESTRDRDGKLKLQKAIRQHDIGNMDRLMRCRAVSGPHTPNGGSRCAAARDGPWMNS